MNARNSIQKRPLFGIALAVILVAILSVLFVSGCLNRQVAYPGDSWSSSTPEEQGIDSEKLADALAAMKKDRVPIHSLLVVRHGRVIVDAYFYPYDGSTYHDVASITKSVMTTLIGIAADQGLVDLDAPIVSYFPDRKIANLDARKKSITVRHLASNTSGLHCIASSGELTLQQMQESADWVQYALDLKALNEPGKYFNYCSPGMHLLSAILQEATGMTALEFARTNLFEPLGITEVDWPADPQGTTRGWGDLALRPPDMARIGYLFLQEGRWGERQVVSREWVRQATRVQITTGEEDDYGYGWRVASPDADLFFYLATGRNGQRILVVPDLDAVIVTTGGGFEWSQIVGSMLEVFGKPQGTLPANPRAVERLEQVVAGLAEPPAPEPVPPRPEIAAAISGKTFTFPANGLGLESLRLEFSDDPAIAVLTIELAHEAGPRESLVGLDGVSRLNRSGRPTAARGWWQEGGEFLVEYSEGPGLNLLMMSLRFEGGGVEFSASRPGHRSLESMVGTMEED
jgi:CubicO group peptidase (beta-lactamase class C family)